MLQGAKSREELDAHAEQLFKRLLKKADRRKLYSDVQKEFGIPISTVEGMITFRRDVSEFSTFEVFAVVYCLDPKCLKKYYNMPH